MALSVGVVGVFHPHGPGHLATLAASDSVGRILVWDEDQSLRHRLACLDGRPDPVDCSYGAELMLAELERCAEEGRASQD